MPFIYYKTPPQYPIIKLLIPLIYSKYRIVVPINVCSCVSPNRETPIFNSLVSIVCLIYLSDDVKSQ